MHVLFPLCALLCSAQEEVEREQCGGHRDCVATESHAITPSLGSDSFHPSVPPAASTRSSLFLSCL